MADLGTSPSPKLRERILYFIYIDSPSLDSPNTKSKIPSPYQGLQGLKCQTPTSSCSLSVLRPLPVKHYDPTILASNKPNVLLPQDLCTCSSLFLESIPTCLIPYFLELPRLNDILEKTASTHTHSCKTETRPHMTFLSSSPALISSVKLMTAWYVKYLLVYCLFPH